MKELLGSLYFTPDVDLETGLLRTKCEGQIVAFIVRRKDDTEFEVRKGTSVRPGQGKPLAKVELETMEAGTKLGFLNDHTPTLEVVKVFPLYGDIWIRNLIDKSQSVCKYFELKRCD